jgi:hypothetical protein
LSHVKGKRQCSSVEYTHSSGIYVNILTILLERRHSRY